MANIVNSWQQMNKQRAKLNEKTSKYQALIRKRQKQSEEYLLKKLSREMGVDLGKIVEEIEKRSDGDRESIRPRLDKLKADVKHFAVQNRNRLNQAIKTYTKRGIIEGYHKLYPNQPHIRMQYAHDWEGSCSPETVPGMTGGAPPPDLAAYWSCDFFFDQELDDNGDPFVVPGHDGLCNKFRAHCIAHAGDDRDGYASATATQTLIFRHDPPSFGPDNDYCGFSELWMPISLTGISYAINTDRVYLHRRLAAGGFAEIGLSIRIEQDTDRGPLLYPVATDRSIYTHADYGGAWIWEGMMAPVHWAPRDISLLLDEPYRLPPMTLLNTRGYGGGEVRVIMTLTCRATAWDRRAEAEIDLASPGFGVEIHESFLRGAGCVRTFSY